MTDRWKKSLEAFDRVEPDRSKLRTRAATKHGTFKPIPEGPQHRAGRVVGVALSIALVGLALVWSTGSLLGLRGDGAPPAASATVTPETNYVVDFLGFDTTYAASPGQVIALLRYSWAADTFPGVRDCDLTALDANGGVVGRFTTRVTVLDPNHPLEGGQEMRVQGDATSVQGTCGPRLDDGTPYEYALDQIGVGRSGQDFVTVSLAAQWLGGGVPGVVNCRFTLVGPGGEIVAVHRSIEPEHTGLRYWDVRFMPEDIKAPLPEHEQDIIPYVSCVPYVDGNETFPEFDRPVLPDAVPIDFTSPSGMGWVFSDVVAHPKADGWETNYRMTWENGVFPGERPCTVTIMGATGDVIKTERFTFEGLQPVADRIIETAEQPSGFDASCGERLDTPIAYVISEPTIVVSDGQVNIRFTVQWPEGLLTVAIREQTSVWPPL